MIAVYPYMHVYLIVLNYFFFVQYIQINAHSKRNFKSRIIKVPRQVLKYVTMNVKGHTNT